MDNLHYAINGDFIINNNKVIEHFWGTIGPTGPQGIHGLIGMT
jgi:hypothetical protein